jgi:hypothetical protein
MTKATSMMPTITKRAKRSCEIQGRSGLQLAAETSAALGLKTGEVEERSVTHTYEVTASVFDAGPPARASSLVPVEIADDLEKHPPAEAKLLSRSHRDFSPALTQVEIVLALPGAPAGRLDHQPDSARTGRHGCRPCRAPRCCAPPREPLSTSSTACSLLRTPVKPGANDGEYIEILDGLYAGDVIATAAVEQLWLTELRLTKGGGHSH